MEKQKTTFTPGNAAGADGFFVTLSKVDLQLGLVGGFNPSEKYQSKWESSPNRDENTKYLKPPPRGGNKVILNHLVLVDLSTPGTRKFPTTQPRRI